MKLKYSLSALLILAALTPLTAFGAWYSNGSLHRATVNQWKNASYQNQLATAADFAIANESVKKKVKGSGDINTLKPYAKKLVNCINTAVQGNDSVNNQHVSQIAASCEVLMH